MSIALLLLLLALEEHPIKAGDLEIYTKLSIEEALVSPTGILHVLDEEEALVYRFDPEGTPLTPLGGQGEGPGELAAPDSLQWVGDQLVVECASSLEVFSANGDFIKRYEQGWSYAVVLEAGVLASEPALFFHDDDQASAYWYAREQTPNEKHEYFKWTRPPRKHQTHAIKKGDVITLTKNPANDKVRVAATVAGDIGYLYIPGSREIKRIDGKHMKQLEPLKLPQPPAFNEAWGEEQVEREKRDIDGKPPRFKVVVVPYLPETYPAMRAMRVLGDKLYVMLWSEAPDKKQPLLAFDANGKEAKPDHSVAAINRIAGIHAGQAWLITYDAEEERANLIRVPLAEVEATIERHPMQWDW